jgi:hypothetical protein
MGQLLGSSQLAIVVSDEGGDSSSPLSCTPLCMVEPSFRSPVVERIGDVVDAISQPSKWVAYHMNMFCK